jgi:hypothetical protein
MAVFPTGLAGRAWSTIGGEDCRVGAESEGERHAGGAFLMARDACILFFAAARFAL